MKSSIVRNLSWVLICSIIAKVLGGVYRIVLTRLLGTSIGLYQIVFSVYSFLVLFVSSGIPLSISKLISSKKSARAKQNIVYSAVAILFTISGIMAIVLIFGCRGLALLQGDKRIFWCYIILAPSIVFSAGSAILKGYYQGSHNFKVSAISGLFEQVVRVISGLVFMLVLQKFYILGALLGAMLGTLLGDIFAFVYLKIRATKYIKVKYDIKNIKNSKQIIKYAFPIMLYSLIVPLSNFIDSFLIIRLLNIHFPLKTSTLLYGLQAGVVGSIISIPTIFSYSLASVLMPTLSGDYSDKNIEQFYIKTRLAFKLILLIVLPCAILFAVNSSNIINILYGGGINGFGVNGQYVAKNLLIISSISVVFSGINQLSAIVLQNLNQKLLPILNLGLGMGAKLIVELMFVPCGMGIYAYAIAVATGFVVSGVLNLYAVERSIENAFNINYLTKQFGLCVLVLGLLTTFKTFNSNTIFILGTIFTIIIYLISIYLIKLFSKEDIKLIKK